MTQDSITDFDLDLDHPSDEDVRVREWCVEQLWRVGLPHFFADVFAGLVDWHELDALVARGCPPLLALDIVR